MSTEETRFFQFLAGERKGEVLIFDRIEQDGGDVYLCFKDDSRCNEDLILPINKREYSNELMAEVESPSNIWTFDEKWVGRIEEKWSSPEDTPDGEIHLVQPFVPGRKQITPIPPRKSTAKFGAISNHVTPAPAPPPVTVNPLVGDPVWLMMDKAKKFDTDVEMKITISLPTKSLYDVAKESFDEGGSKVIEYIIENLDNQKLKESLKTALMEAYGEEIKSIVPELEIPTMDLGEPVAVEEPVVRTATAEEIKELGDREQKRRVELEEEKK